MITQNTTQESIRIEKETLSSIRLIVPYTGQTISGYIKTILLPKVKKDLQKYGISTENNS